MKNESGAGIKIVLPEYVEAVLSALERCGWQAYCVGGCVRDSLMGVIPDDYDIATDAPPKSAAACFGGMTVLETGLKHGTITVRSAGKNVEVTTFRRDGTYSDGRRPDSVYFTKSLAEDLARRDFTINAMAYSHKSGVVDMWGGAEHIERRIVACVGDPYKRFCEDALRVLRALRFAAVLGFDIEPHTSDAAVKCSGLVTRVSAERIYVELSKLLNGAAAHKVIAEYGEVLAAVIFGADSAQTKDFNRAAAIIKYCTADKITRLAALLYSVLPSKAATGTTTGEAGIKTAVSDTLRSLKADGETTRAVKELLIELDKFADFSEITLKRTVSRLGYPQAKRLVALLTAIASADGREDIAEHGSYAQKTLNRLEMEGVCVTIDMLALDGSDLIAAGINEGKKIGDTLDMLLDGVISGRLENTRDALLFEVNKTI